MNDFSSHPTKPIDHLARWVVSITLLVACLLLFWINCFRGCFGANEWSPDAF
jgi:hypothetical protein